MVTAMKRPRVRVARATEMATRVLGEGQQRQQRGLWQQRGVWWATKRALVMEIAIVTATRVAGNEEDNGKGS
jgi:hypothetical protein